MNLIAFLALPPLFSLTSAEELQNCCVEPNGSLLSSSWFSDSLLAPLQGFYFLQRLMKSNSLNHTPLCQQESQAHQFLFFSVFFKYFQSTGIIKAFSRTNPEPATSFSSISSGSQNLRRGRVQSQFLAFFLSVYQSAEEAVSDCSTVKYLLFEKSYQADQNWNGPLLNKQMYDSKRVVPFIPPTQIEREKALGSLAGEKWVLKKSLSAILNFFEPQGQAKPKQWLYQQQQDGQPFQLYKSIDKKYIDLKTESLYIGTHNKCVQKKEIQKLKYRCQAFFLDCSAKIKHLKLDLAKFNPIKSSHGVYYDASVLTFQLDKLKPADAYAFLLIIDQYLYCTSEKHIGESIQQQNKIIQKDWIYGLTNSFKRTGVISLAQIKRQILQYQSQISLFQFLNKVVLHEFGHCFAIKHCIYYRCLMNGSNHFKQASQKYKQVCPICLRKLQHNIGFEVVKRYERLSEQDQWFSQLAKAVRLKLSS